MSLDLVVRDRDGRPLTDLSADEIQVFENGVRAEIVHFRLAKLDEPTQEPTQTPAPLPVTPSSTVAQARDLVVVFVVDALSSEGARKTREAIEEFLGRSQGSRTWFALFRVGEGLQPVVGFTRDPDAVRGALQSIAQGRAYGVAIGPDRADRGRPPGVHTGLPGEQASGQKVQDKLKGTDKLFRDVEANLAAFADEMERLQRGRDTIYPLLALVRALRELDARKSILLFTEGLHVARDSRYSLQEAFKDLIAEASRANVTVYGFSAESLQGPNEAGNSYAPVFKQEPRSRASVEGDPMLLQTNLGAVAEETGGRLVANTNDLRSGARSAAAELRSWYEIAYVPPNTKPGYRRIEVKVARKGVAVHNRAGYLAGPNAAPTTATWQLALLEALAAKTLARDLDHRAGALIGAAAGEGTEVTLAVEVPVAAEPAPGQPRLLAGEVSILALVKDGQGREVTRVGMPASGTRPSAGEAASSDVLLVKQQTRLAPGRYTLESAVHDRASGRVGARRTPFVVPDTTGALAMGTLAMGRVVPGAGSVADDAGSGRLSSVVPTLYTHVAQGTPNVVFLVSARAPAEPKGSIAVELRSAGRVLERSERELPAPDASGRISYPAVLRTAQLPPGRYEVWAMLSQGDATVSQASTFTVDAPPIAAGATQPQEPPARESQPQTAATQAAPAEPAAAQAAAARPAGAEGELGRLLDLAGSYVSRYADSFRNLVAEERRRQWWEAGDRTESRTTTADTVFVRLPGPLPWGVFRDVFERDGQPLRPRDGRLESIFAQPRNDAVDQANAILRESARQNLGPVYRTANSPTLALLFLLPEHRSRFAFTRKGKRTFDGLQGVEIAYKETGRPTLVRDRGRNDMPVHGRFWVDPARGAVLRSEAGYALVEVAAAARGELPEQQDVAFIATQYRLQPALDILVPVEMYELYTSPAAGRIEVRSEYSKYRRFTVSVEEQVAR